MEKKGYPYIFTESVQFEKYLKEKSRDFKIDLIERQNLTRRNLKEMVAKKTKLLLPNLGYR